MLGVKWCDHVKNVNVAVATGLPSIDEIVCKRRNALFGHIIRLDIRTLAHQVRNLTKSCHCPDVHWRRLRTPLDAVKTRGPADR